MQDKLVLFAAAMEPLLSGQPQRDRVFSSLLQVCVVWSRVLELAEHLGLPRGFTNSLKSGFLSG